MVDSRHRPIYGPDWGEAIIRPGAERPVPHTSSQQNGGSSCTYIDFSGLSQLQSIPTFQGISFPNWQALVQGQPLSRFANAPNTNTIAFWLNDPGPSQNILIPNGATSISFYYSSYNPITLTAYDSSGNTLATATGAANYDFNTLIYDQWNQIKVTAPRDRRSPRLTSPGRPTRPGSPTWMSARRP